MRGLSRFLAPLIAGVALAACATASPYAPQTTPGGEGYSEVRLDEAHWRVEFVGDESTSAPIVERSLLLRAAQLTQTSGYDWFKPSDHSAGADTEIVVEGRRQTAREGLGAVWRPYWRRHGVLGWSDWRPRGPDPAGVPQSRDHTVRSVERYAARETIEMGHGDKPVNAFDAAAVVDLLSPAVSAH